MEVLVVSDDADRGRADARPRVAATAATAVVVVDDAAASGDGVAAQLTVFFVGDFFADVFNVDLQSAVFGRQFADILEGNGGGGRGKPTILRPLLLHGRYLADDHVQTLLLGTQLRDEMLVASPLMND